MDKAQAFNTFWNSFDIPAYDKTSVPQTVGFPRITYTMELDNWEHTLLVDASVWYRETSWRNATAKVEQIGKYIDDMPPIPCEGGYLRIMRGNPFAQRLEDEDNMVKRYYINLQVEFLTRY